MLKNQMFKWLHTLRGKIFTICLFIAISVMMLSMYMLYTRSVKTIEENAFNSSLIAYKNHILMAAVVGVDGRCYQAGGDLILKSITSEQWFENTKSSTSVRILYNTPEDERIFLCRPIKYNKETVAIAIIELDFEIISKVYNVTPLEQAQIITFDAYGNVVFSNSNIGDVKNINETPLYQSIKEYRPDRRYYEIDGENKLMVLYNSTVNQLTTIGLISYNDLITDALQIQKNMYS